jgi:hypothetical protein
MPNDPYAEFSVKWKTKIEVDYFTEFVKTWIAFNAWYKMTYQNENTDRQIIDRIKEESNSVRDRIRALLSPRNDEENRRFKENIGLLHRELERKHIHNKGERITFEAVITGNNPNRQLSESRRGILYNINCVYQRGELSTLDVVVANSNGNIFQCQQTVYDYREVTNMRDYGNLSVAQKEYLEAFYRDLRPKLTENLLKDEEPNTQMGEYTFSDDTTFLAKGIIEILYLIRNSLFHGSIIPDKETNGIYERGYQILKMIVEVL